MHVGYMALGLGPMAAPQTLAAAARMAESAGFHSIWACDHIVLVDRHEMSAYPYSPDAKFPTSAASSDFLDPFVALAFAAAHTSQIRIGTGICLVPERNPLITAKQVASLDNLSRGRLDFGVGVGWLKEEFLALGVPWDKRIARTREYLMAMRELWTSESPKFAGEFCEFSGVRMYPKPVQNPHPPIIWGGESDAALRRVVETGDGWYGMNMTVERASACIAKISAYAAAIGRDVDELTLSVNPGMGEVLGERELEQLKSIGVDQIIMGSFAATQDEVEAEIDRIAADVISVAGAL